MKIEQSIDSAKLQKFRQKWEPISFAFSLMVQSKNHALLPMSYVLKAIGAAKKHQYLKFYFDDCGVPIGYVMWAFLAPDVEKRVMKTGIWDLHESEWNEGESFWIVDLLVPSGNVRPILRDMRDVLFPNEKVMSYLRVKNNRVIGKQIDRDCCSYFFQSKNEK